TDVDARWPVVATQLATPERHPSPWHGGAPATPGPGTPAGTLAAAGMAVGQTLAILAWPDGGPVPATLATTIEIDAADGIPVVRRWTTHPACGCGALAPLDRVPAEV